MVNKTLTIQSYNRPKLLQRCLNHIEQLKGIGSWKCYGIVDGGGENSKKCRQIMMDTEFIHYRKFHTTNLGLRKCTKNTLSYIFEDVESEVNLHIEEDLLLGPDSLKLIEHTIDYWKYDTHTTTLWTHPNVNQKSNKIRKASRFSCWGWATHREFYMDYIKDWLNNPDYYYDDSWACSVRDGMMAHGFKEYFPLMRRCKQTGFESGVHDNSDAKERLGGDLEAWTGEKFEPSYEYEMKMEYPHKESVLHEQQ